MASKLGMSFTSVGGGMCRQFNFHFTIKDSATECTEFQEAEPTEEQQQLNRAETENFSKTVNIKISDGAKIKQIMT